MTKKITKLVILFAMIALVILVSLNLTSGADDIEIATSVELEKYINYQLSDNDKGTLVQYNIKLGMEYLGEYNDFPIKESEIAVNLNQIDGKYPSGVKVITKGTQATNGKNRDMTENYSYDTNSGNLVIKASNENENGDKIYNQAPNSNAKDEYLVICYYDTYTAENPEREVSCNVSAKTVLFENNRELNSNQEFSNKVTQNTSELTSASIRTSEIYNGQIKSNIINGTQTGTEYKEIEQIVVSKKEEQQKIEISQNDTLVNNEKEIGNNKNILYKSTKVKKDNLLKLLGEDGNIQIFDANSNLVATINKDSEWEEDGSLTINYDSGLENIKVKTSQIQSEGILELYNSKEISNTMKDINNNKIKSNMTIKGINETRTQEEITNEETGEKTTQEKIVEEQAYERNNQNDIEIKDSTTDVTVNINNTNWTNKQQNEITFDIYLNSNSSKNNMFNNPTVRVNLPAEVEKVILNKSSIVYANGLELQDPYIETNKDGTLSIVANLTGVQSNYMDSSLGLMTDVQIQATIILKKDVENKTSNIQCVYTNKFTLDNSVEEGNITKEISLENYKEENTQQITQEGVIYDSATTLATADNSNIDKLKVEVSPVKGDTVIKDGDTVYEGEYIKYNIKVTNTADTAIDNIKVVGGVPDGTTYGELEADYFTYQGKYEYNFNENIKEKTINIGSLKAGESVEKFYEVRVNDLQEEDEKQIQTSIKAYVEQTEASKYELTNMVKTAEAKIFVDAKLDSDTNRWNYGINLKGEQGREVKVKIKFPKEFDLKWIGIGTKGELEEIEKVDYIQVLEDNVILATLKINNNDLYSFEGEINESKIKKNSDESQIELCTTASIITNNSSYCANENRIICRYQNASITMESPNEGEEVKYGDEIEYDIIVRNTGGTNLDTEKSSIEVNISDFLPEELDPISMTYETWEEEKELINEENQIYVTKGNFIKNEFTEDINFSEEDEDGNTLPNINIDCTIPYKETIRIKIKTKAGIVYEKTKIENITTISSEETIQNENGEEEIYSSIGTKQSNTVTHTILPYNYKPLEDPDNPERPDNPDKPNSDKYTISGEVWVDENKDGQKQIKEKRLDGIEVTLIDAENSNIISEDIKTDSSGTYKFENLKSGKYIVAFKYDEEQYRLTEYKKSGISSSVNSDIMSKELTINGENRIVGVTDILSLDASISNIDAGLIKNEICDLKLDKYISKVSVTTKSGTKEYNYNNKQLAKLEINSKEIEGATVIVEYKLVITNEGELPARVTRLADYIPNGLNFSSELNKSWSLMQNGKIVNTSSTNQKINPGETIELSLILNKKMVSNATGTYTNIAEIDAMSNDLGIQDVDSTPGNKIETEDDYSKAELIISIGTGAFTYISIGVVILLFVVTILIVRNKKININIHRTIIILLFALIFVGGIFLQSINVEAEGIEIKKDNVSAYKAPKNVTFSFLGGTHGTKFSGGPEGVGGTCDNYGRPNQDMNPPYYKNYTLYSVKYTPNNNGKVTGSIKYNEAPSLEKTQDTYEIKSLGSTHKILGPFKVNRKLEVKDVTFTVKDSDGNVINDGVICNKKGNKMANKTKTKTFYLKISNNNIENGVSSVKLKNKTTVTGVGSGYKDVNALYTPSSIKTAQKVRSKYRVIGNITKTKKVNRKVVWGPINSDLTIIKVDADNNDVTLANVKFNISGPSFPQGINCETDSKGEIVLQDILPGTYTITETENPHFGYKDNVVTTVEVVAGADIEQEIENSKSLGDLKIYKEDLDNGDPLNGVGFKIKSKDENKYIKFNNIVGNVYGELTVSSMETVNNKEQATEFFSNDQGYIAINGMEEGSYIVEETTINNKYYGYVLDGDYISWSDYNDGTHRWTSNGNLKGTQAYVWVGADDESSIFCYNERKYIKLSGYVWVDKAQSGKGGEYAARNNFYRETSIDNNDERLKDTSISGYEIKGVRDVQLINGSDSGKNQKVKVNNNGEYIFENVFTRDIKNGYYKVQFEYDGLLYTNVPVTDEGIKKPNGSKAKESSEKRNQLNAEFYSINNAGAADENEIIKHNLSYEEQNGNDGEPKKKSIFRHTEFYSINADTNNARVSLNDEWKKCGYGDKIENINLGLYEREMPKYGLGKDLYSVKLTINNKSHTYLYNKDNINNATSISEVEKNRLDKNGWNVGVRWQRKTNKTSYYRAIYKEDAEYINKEEKNRELEMYITYKIAIHNDSETLTGRINNIIEYYDKNYESIKAGENIDESCELQNELEVMQNEQYSMYENIGYNMVMITKSIEIAPQTDKNIYVQFKLSREQIYSILNSNDNNNEIILKNIAEIGSYTSYDKNGIYAGIDKISKPGNAGENLSNTNSYEYDTDYSGTLKLEYSDPREMTGKVFLDDVINPDQNTIIDTDELMTGKERKGNGVYNDDERGISGVDVQLTETSGTHKVYSTTTNENGEFSIPSYIPGDYTLTYTWGDDKYPIQKYKATIYQYKTRQYNAKWYQETGDIYSKLRLSDAMDDYGIRKTIDDNMKLNNKDGYFSEDGTTKEDYSLKMKSKTPAMDISIENLEKIITDGKDSNSKIEHVDFGIIERPRQAVQLTKKIEKVKLTLANGQVIVDAKRDEKGNLSGEMKHTTHMDPVENDSNVIGRNNGFLKLELDNELMQGSVLEVEYGIYLRNISELDYDYFNYYTYGTISDYLKNSPTQIKSSKIIDYLGKDWNFDRGQNSEAWTQEQDIKELVSDDIANNTNEYTKLKIEEEKYLKPGEETTEEEIPHIRVSKILSSTDEIVLNNEAEVVELKKTGGSSMYNMTVANYEPGGEEHESDDDMGETVTVTPSTGKNLNYIIPGITAIVMLIILGIGIILIKRKVLNHK